MASIYEIILTRCSKLVESMERVQFGSRRYGRPVGAAESGSKKLVAEQKAYRLLGETSKYECSETRYLFSSFQFIHVELRDSNVFDLSFVFEFFHSLDGLFEIYILWFPVNVVEIDVIYS